MSGLFLINLIDRALGLLLYSMCAGTLGCEHREFINSVTEKTWHRETYPIKTCYVEDSECMDLLKRMLVVDPTKRITMRGVLIHPYCRK